MWKLIVLAATLGAALFLLAPRPSEPVHEEPVADVYIAVGFLPWLDAAALRVLPEQTGSWSLRAVVEGLSARVDELEG